MLNLKLCMPISANRARQDTKFHGTHCVISGEIRAAGQYFVVKREGVLQLRPHNLTIARPVSKVIPEKPSVMSEGISLRDSDAEPAGSRLHPNAAQMQHTHHSLLMRLAGGLGRGAVAEHRLMEWALSQLRHACPCHPYTLSSKTKWQSPMNHLECWG